MKRVMEGPFNSYGPISFNETSSDPSFCLPVEVFSAVIKNCDWLTIRCGLLVSKRWSQVIQSQAGDSQALANSMAKIEKGFVRHNPSFLFLRRWSRSSMGNCRSR